MQLILILPFGLRVRSGTLATEDPAGRIVKTSQASFLGMLGLDANAPCSVADLTGPSVLVKAAGLLLAWHPSAH